MVKAWALFKGEKKSDESREAFKLKSIKNFKSVALHFYVTL